MVPHAAHRIVIRAYMGRHAEMALSACKRLLRNFVQWISFNAIPNITPSRSTAFRLRLSQKETWHVDTGCWRALQRNSVSVLWTPVQWLYPAQRVKSALRNTDNTTLMLFPISLVQVCAKHQSLLTMLRAWVGRFHRNIKSLPDSPTFPRQKEETRKTGDRLFVPTAPCVLQNRKCTTGNYMELETLYNTDRYTKVIDIV